jgi:hypothetical protein
VLNVFFATIEILFVQTINPRSHVCDVIII